MFEYYSTLLGTQNSSSDNLDGFLPDGLEDIKLELVTKNVRIMKIFALAIIIIKLVIVV